MGIGYACLTVGVEGTGIRTCTAKNASTFRLIELIQHNLESLDHILEYNKREGISLFRISSDIIPFGSSPINRLEWEKIFEKEFGELGEKIRKNGIRVSMHPGQYSILNSPREEVVERTIKDLEYHTRFLQALNTSAQSKIILHIGGKYQDSIKAVERFCINYEKLNDAMKERLVIENDDRMYSIEEVLSISRKMDIPVVFDNLHHIVNSSQNDHLSEEEWIKEAGKTWRRSDGKQKIHFSCQDPEKQPGAHSKTIPIQVFKAFYERNHGEKLDIMLEVKDKNLSAVKCNNLIRKDSKIKHLEEEWGRYKYNVLEHSQSDYQKIRKLLKNKEEYPALAFYTLLEETMDKTIDKGNAINSILHVWGYFKKKATLKEKEKFQEMIRLYEKDCLKKERLKKYLFQLAMKYHEDYLLHSLFFTL